MASRLATAAFGAALVLIGAATAAGAALTGAAIPAAAANPAASQVAAGPPPPGLSVALQPCNPVGGACSVSPRSLAVTLPPGTVYNESVQVTWSLPGQPAADPGPASSSVILPLSAGGCRPSATAPITCMWPWPGVLEVAGSGIVLDGAYQVAACAAPPAGAAPRGSAPPPPSAAPSCSPLTSPTPTGFAVAALPANPSGVRAFARTRKAGAPVDISWAVGPEPDLAGYTLALNGTPIYRCTLHGAAIAGAGPCASRPAFTDKSPRGTTLTYGVTAERFGVDANTAHDVYSGVTAVTIIQGVSGAAIALPPAPYHGAPPALPAVYPPGVFGSTGAPGASPATPTTTTDPGYGNLPFGARNRLARGSLSNGAGKGPSDVHRLALIAAGLLVLALAAHLFYLRGAIGRYQAMHAGGSAPTPTSGARGRRVRRWSHLARPWRR